MAHNLADQSFCLEFTVEVKVHLEFDATFDAWFFESEPETRGTDVCHGEFFLQPLHMRFETVHGDADRLSFFGFAILQGNTESQSLFVDGVC